MTVGEAWTAGGYLTGALVFLWMARRRRLSTEGIWLIAAWGFVAAIAGAKIAELVAEGWPVKLPLWLLADPRSGGRALLGGVVGGWIGVEVAKRRLGIKRSTGDLFAPALAAGEAVGRIGCFFNGCCYGCETGVPWAVWQHGAWRHPAQLYSSAVAALTFGVLAWLEVKREGLREGDLFRIYLVTFGATRFGLEFVRWRESVIWGLSPMQWFCLDLVVIGVVSLVRSRRGDSAKIALNR